MKNRHGKLGIPGLLREGWGGRGERVPEQSGGMEQTFRLDAQQYHALTVGDKGTLSYKGTRFVSFVGEQ